MNRKPSIFQRIIAFYLIITFCFQNTLPVVFASEINQNNVPFQTATTIEHSDNVFNISTTTTNSGGDVGVNSFGKFNVTEGDVVNLNLINAQNKLVNVVFDSSSSQIDGIVNSYKNGQIGGNVLFANPNGFVVGSSGVFNVGSLTLITPTESFMKSLFRGNESNPSIVNDNMNSLITFNMNGSDYLLLGGGTTAAVQLNPAPITVDGTINSGSGIDIITGGSGTNGKRNINLNEGSTLNANMTFSGSGANVTATPKTNATPTAITTETTEDDKQLQNYKLAIDGGNNITIVASNQMKNRDYMSSIVNLDGAINANGADLVAQTEVYNMNWETDKSNSEITVNSHADINAHDINLNAVSKATTLDHDLLGIKNRTSDGFLGVVTEYINPAAWTEAIVDNFVHLGDQKTKVTIEDGAKLNANNDVNLVSRADLPISANSVMETFDLNFLDLKIDTESVVKSGAHITAGNDLKVQAITKLNLIGSTKATNMAEIVADNVFQNSFGHYGAYAVTVGLIDATNKAVIEKGAVLGIQKDIKVLADMVRDVTYATQNGFIPIFDKNRGVAGVGISVVNVNSTNAAIMNADADIDGTLTVNADYTGKLTSSTVSSAGSQGEGGEFGGGGAFVSSFVKYVLGGWIKGWSDRVFNHLGANNPKQRMEATFGKIQVAGALNIAIDDAKNYAKIGDADSNIKPTINAKNVILNSQLVDHKSNIYAQSSTLNSETSAAGAVAVNYKGVDSDAKAYGNFNLTGGDSSTQALIVNSITKVERPSALDSLWSFLNYLGIKNYQKTKPENITEVNSSNVNDYLNQLGISSTMQEDIDQTESVFNLFKIFDYLNFHDVGMHNFFNTFATSQATAATREGKTSAFAGAVTTAIYNTNSNAELVGGSKVNLLGADATKNNITIKAETESTMWAGASLANLFNFKTLFAGTAARDGDSVGGSVSVQYGNIDTTAKIGDGAVITTSEGAAAGDLNLNAIENGQFINIGVGSSGADGSGTGGVAVISALTGGETKATIEDNAEVEAKDANIEATKDDNLYHAVFAYANGNDSKSFGASAIILADDVESSIGGTLNASGNVKVNSVYDKMFLNTTVNAGVVTQGVAPNIPVVNAGAADGDENNFVNGIVQLAANEEGGHIENPMHNAENIANLVNGVNPGEFNRNTASYAGNILVNYLDSDVVAYIKNGAKVTSAGSVDVLAKSIDRKIEAGGILAANGKSGGGATLSVDISKNNIQAYVDAAEVDATNNINVNAEEDNQLITATVGIVQAKDTSGAGSVAFNIQKNNVESSIKNGSKINTETDKETQSVIVTSKLTNKLIKATGSASVQAGSVGGDASAKGATIDGDIAINTVKANIENSEVNAGKEVKVDANQTTTLIDVAAAGAASLQGSSYDGTVALYLSKGETDAHISDTTINKSQYSSTARTNKSAETAVNASNTFDSVTVTGTVAGGNSNAGGGSVRVDWISDEINSYIKNTELDSNDNLTMKNSGVVDSIAVTVAGNLSLNQKAFGGATMLVVNDTDQNNYIDNSTIDAKEVTLDTDSTFDSLGITGAVTAATTGSAIGGSIYTAIADNDINTYILNSDVTSDNNIALTTDFDSKPTSITFGGSGGKGIAAAGSISTYVNNSDSNTYVKSESGKKNNIESTNGELLVKGTNDIDIKNINGAVAISLSEEAAGASINTVVDNNDLYAATEGVNVKAKGNTEVSATSDDDVMAISIGGAGGSGIAAAGSINTIVMASDIQAYVKDSDVKSETGDIKVTAFDDAVITGGTGALSASMSSFALGASVVTGVDNNLVRAAIENSKTDAANDIIVSSTANETIGESDKPFITVAGGFSKGLTATGVVDTLVINSTSDAHISGTKTVDSVAYGAKAGNEVKVTSEGKDTLYAAGGAVSASTSIGVGATVNTVVIDKDVYANAENTKIEANNITAKANEEDDFFTTVIAAGGGKDVGGAGVINTNVITSEINSGFKNSELTATNNIGSDATSNAEMMTITGAVAGGGMAGVGLSAVNDIVRYRAHSYGDDVTATFKDMDINASADSTYKFSTVSGAGGGEIGGAGVENVNAINNEVIAFSSGTLTGETIDVNASDKVTFTDSYSGAVAGGGTGGVGATIEVNSISSTILAHVGGNITADEVNAKAHGEQTFNGIVAAGFAGGGTVAGAGTALANLVETTTKAYVENNSTIANTEDSAASKVNLEADNKLDLVEYAGSGAISLGGAVGATVGVNKIKNTVEAYTGDNVTITANETNISAKSENNIGKEDTDKHSILVAGSGGLVGIAGTVFYNSVEDTVDAHVGKNNTINISDNGKLNVKAEDITKLYELLGTGAGGAYAGIGASVGYNTIENTVLSYIGPSSTVNAPNADVSILSNSNEIISGTAAVISGGIAGISGGVLYSSIGKKVENASYNSMADSDIKVFNAAKTQSTDVTNTGSEKMSGADSAYKKAYSDAINKAKGEVDENSKINNMNSPTTSLFEKSAFSGSSTSDTAEGRNKTTSAFVDTASTINAKTLSVKAEDEDSITYTTAGAAGGAVAVGVSAAVSDIETTTNAFVSKNATINATSFEVVADSNDTQKIDTYAAAGGVLGGSGSVAMANSNKTTNTYLVGDSTITTTEKTLITTTSTSDIKTTANALSVAGVAVGVSRAEATSTGSTKIDIGENVTLMSNDGNDKGEVSIITNSNEKVSADAWAASGGGLSGTGAHGFTKAGKDSSIDIGKNFVVDAKNDLRINSIAKNDSHAETSGRAYGGVSAGGTKTEADVDHKSGVSIADADETKTITAGTVDISSKADNKAETKTLAGAGAALGIAGSGAYTDIKSVNNVLVGSNYDIITNIGGYSVIADSLNKYKSFNDGSAYGAIAVAIPLIGNIASSTVSAKSYADVTSNADIIVKASNEVKKDSVSNYDLYGGSGGLASGLGASIEDTVTMTTEAVLAGSKAHANGAFGSGNVDASALNIANINEKASLLSGAGIAGADTDSKVQLNAYAKTQILNKDIQTKYDYVNFISRNDVNIYTKSNVESYGGVAGAGGNSSAKSNEQKSEVIIDGESHTRAFRDVNIKALNNKTLNSYIYARTKGLVSVLNDEANAHNLSSVSAVNIKSGATVKSLDSIHLESSNHNGGISAKRDSKAYEIGFIEYTGSGREYTTNNAISYIQLDGDIESGLGSHKNLTIEYDENNNVVTSSEDDAIQVSKEKVGEVTAADVDIDITAFENNKTTHTEQYNAYVTAQNELKAEYQASYDSAKTQKETLVAENTTKAESIAYKETEITATNTSIVTVNNAMADINSKTKEEFISAYNNSGITGLQEAIEAYIADSNKDSCYVKLQSTKVSLTQSVTTLNSEIQTLTSEIATNNTTIATQEAAMTSAQNKITEINDDMTEKEVEYNLTISILDNQIAALQAKKAQAEENAIPVYSMNVEDVVVRSGEVSIVGNVSGNGSITAAGNSFSIDVKNDTLSNVQLNNLIIDRDAKGGINVTEGSIASSVQQILKDSGKSGRTITITNSIDANDPTLNMDRESNAGDIVLNKNVENVYGSLNITNNTGDVISQGNITVKDLKLTVPNGGYDQVYVDSEQKLGGSAGTGAIVAAGNIDISAKTLDVNGLIQSGTEIKTVEIPDFSVIKKDGKYYQVVDSVETEMKESEVTEGYYYINTTSDTSDLAAMQQIKAYFKPSDSDATENVPGEIYLFKAETSAGNVTLTGNIISSSTNGKIVLINGYGHIDVTNNSNYDFITNTVNADTKDQGVLTINDFAFGTNKDGGDTFKNLSESSITEDFLSANAAEYKLFVNDDGLLQSSSSGQFDMNGSLAVEGEITTRADGAKVYSTTYNPGSDAYSLKSESQSYTYKKYIPRSWLKELFYGKLYIDVPVYKDAEYEVKNNPITVVFQGFDAPEVNITSKGDVVMNNSITSMTGDVNISSNGDILTNSTKNVITAKNITLKSDNNVGQVLDDLGTIKPIQIEILDNGSLNISSNNSNVTDNNVYINFPYTDVSNINITGKDVYISTDKGDMNGESKTVRIDAEDLTLQADSINFVNSAESLINIDKINAISNEDISIKNKGDLTVGSILSKNKGTINLESTNGSIKASSDTGTYSNENINGGDITLYANGSIGDEETPLSFTSKGIFNVFADSNIYMKSANTMYVDKISSQNGSVNLNADLGIIASEISDEDRVFNLSSAGDMNLISKYGNIENLAINADGEISAIAGYDGTSEVSGLGDVNIMMISIPRPTDEDVAAIKAGTKSAESFFEGAKDMKIGTIKASNNVTIAAEKALKNSSSSSSISGENISIHANGDVGAEDSAINLTANREISVTTGSGNSVYLTTTDEEKGLKIANIDTPDNTGSLKSVVITSAGNITNASSTIDGNHTDNPIIKAKNITINAENKNIGEDDNPIVVQTTKADAYEIVTGLSYSANNAFIKGVNDLLFVSNGETTEDSSLSGKGVDLAINDIVSTNGSLILQTDQDIALHNADAFKNISAKGHNVNLYGIKLGGYLDSNADRLYVETSNELPIGTISGNSERYSDSVIINSTKAITNGHTADNNSPNISAKTIVLNTTQNIGTEEQMLIIDLPEVNTVDINAGTSAYINNNGTEANYRNLKAEEVHLDSEKAIRIENLEADKIDLKTSSKDVSISHGIIRSEGKIQTEDKDIIIDNNSYEPRPDVTGQLHIPDGAPIYLIIDETKHIQTQTRNVTRHNNVDDVNRTYPNSSMEVEITTSVESGLKNSNFGETAFRKMDSELYNMPILSDYISKTGQEEGYNFRLDHINNVSESTMIMNIVNTAKRKSAASDR